jgi:DNA gyrase subunit A
VRSNGLIAMTLDEEDYLGWVKLTTGNQDLILVTRNGMSIRFNERDVRVMGRNAAGVSAIRFRGDDELTGMDVIHDPDLELLVVTQYGYAKRTPLHEYGCQRRYGMGIRTLAKDEHKTGPIIGSSVVSPEDGLTIITVGGIALRTEVNTISRYGRITSGVKLIDLADDDSLVSIAIVSGTPPEDRMLPPLSSANGDQASELMELTDEEIAALEDEVDAELEDEYVEDGPLNGDYDDEESSGDGAYETNEFGDEY